MTVYLGFSCSQHDPSIAVVNEDGIVRFAEANERGLKSKRCWHVPPDAFGLIEPILERYIQDDLISANLTWSQTALKSVPYLTLASRLALVALEFINSQDREVKLWMGWLFRHALYRAPSSMSNLLLNLELRIKEQKGFRHRLTKKAWNHHLCHAATACFSSPFDDALCVVMDGMGEGSSTSVFSYRDGKIKRLDRPEIANLSSLGIFYSQLCFAAGFDPLAGEEWKLMGLASYGSLDSKLYDLMRGAIKVNKNRLLFSRSYTKILEQLIPYRQRNHGENADFAFTAQRVFEEVLFEFINAAYHRWGGENLIFTGGCALNSSANGKILASTPFRRLHIPMAPSDDGNSIGAALLAWQIAHPNCRVPQFSTPYLGSELNRDVLKRVQEFGMTPCFTTENPAQLYEFIAENLVQGAIIGCMQGRAEFGHRALGNRSILADPMAPNIKDRINASIKFREEFRPFAPSILHEFGHDYFQDYDESPYMERTLKWLPGRAPAGVCHVDGTGRLQSVTKEGNTFLYEIISAFHRKTGMPILLNTSFNVMGRPMVHDIEDAIGVFLTTGLDLLILGNSVYKKTAKKS